MPRNIRSVDISQYFQAFSPTSSQLRRLRSLAKQACKRWGVFYTDEPLGAVLILAPGPLSELTPAAYELLRRCSGRRWSFKVSLTEKVSIYSNETYGDTFGLLESLGLIREGTLSQKIWGSTTVQELHSVLKDKGVGHSGPKDKLVQTVMDCVSQEVIQAWVGNEVWYETTEVGDQALDTINDLRCSVSAAFSQAAYHVWRELYGDQSPPSLPTGVLYDDGEVQITEADVDRALATWDRLMPEELRGLLDAEVVNGPEEDDDDGD